MPYNTFGVCRDDVQWDSAEMRRFATSSCKTCSYLHNKLRPVALASGGVGLGLRADVRVRLEYDAIYELEFQPKARQCKNACKCLKCLGLGKYLQQITQKPWFHTMASIGKSVLFTCALLLGLYKLTTFSMGLMGLLKGGSDFVETSVSDYRAYFRILWIKPWNLSYLTKYR